MTSRPGRVSMREGPLSNLFRGSDAVRSTSGTEQLFTPTDDIVFPNVNSYVAVIRVVGVGGAGGNAINRMVEAGLRGVEFIAINTDRQALDACNADIRIPVGIGLTHGRGTGGDLQKGEQAIRDAEDQIRRALKGSDLVFIAAGQGGGMGTGGAPMVARIARELGALAVAVVTKPFSFEGKRRVETADEGVARLHETADTVIVIPNDRLMTVLERGTSMVSAFQVTDDLLRQGVQGICDMITLPGLINLDFADVRTVIRDAGEALLGIGYAGGGNRAAEAAQAAISSALLETPIDGAQGVLLGITGGPDLSLMEVSEAAEVVAAAADPNANIIFGAAIDPDLAGQVWVTVVAANFSGVRAAPPANPEAEMVAARSIPRAIGRSVASVSAGTFGGDSATADQQQTTIESVGSEPSLDAGQ
jgi:cell division protein FtsZ